MFSNSYGRLRDFHGDNTGSNPVARLEASVPPADTDETPFERQKIRAVPPRPAHGPLGLLGLKSFVAFLWQIAPIGPVWPTPPVFKSIAVNKMPLERHLHTVEVAGSNPAAPTINQSK
jgi:hypothetical protein